MRPVDKALWYIESHFGDELNLDEIAGNAHVSKYYLLRAFSAATGLSIMRYVRGRRLSDGAKRLAAGADDILSIAVECGYGSHEAFTRAFRDQFGMTPEAVRSRGHLQDIPIVEPIATHIEPHNEPFMEIELPRFENCEALLVAGLGQRYEGLEAGAGIPAQWQRFARYLGSIPAQIGKTTYGVCYNTDDEGGMDYLCSVAVKDFGSLPTEFTRLRIAPQRYVVFWHRDHISTIRRTWNTIWNQWMPQSGHEAVDAPLFERYDERFDPQTGAGGVELWIPVK